MKFKQKETRRGTRVPKWVRKEAAVRETTVVSQATGGSSLRIGRLHCSNRYVGMPDGGQTSNTNPGAQLCLAGMSDIERSIEKKGGETVSSSHLTRRRKCSERATTAVTGRPREFGFQPKGGTRDPGTVFAPYLLPVQYLARQTSIQSSEPGFPPPKLPMSGIPLLRPSASRARVTTNARRL